MKKKPNKDFLHAEESLSIDELRALQLKKLKWSVRHAYDNVAIYRNKCSEKSVHPDDLKSLADLQHFPFTVKDDLRSSYPFGWYAVPMNEVARVHASSGTTGNPTVVGYTRSDLDVWSDVIARSIRAAGGEAGDKVHVAYGYGLFTGGLGAHYGAEKLGCTVIPMSGGQTQRQAKLIQDFDPDIIMCTPSYLLNIADHLEEQGADLEKLSLRVGILGAEPWTDEMRAVIERRLPIDALNIYGLSEIIGPGVSQELLSTKDGLTIWEDHFYPEIVDPVSGEVLPEGEAGELVFTTLSKEAMPVIRYRSRDLTRLLAGSGRNMRRMDRITGRSDDMFIIRGVNVYPSQIEELVMKIPEISPNYLLELNHTDNLVQLTVNLELASADDVQLIPRLSERLAHDIKDHIGISAMIKIHPPGKLAKSEGKACRMVVNHK